jgi:two-component system nitrate/nitrite response regulator NarL
LIDPNTLCREGLAWIMATTRFRPHLRLASLEQLADAEIPEDRDVIFLVDFGADPEVSGAGVRRLKARYPSSRLLVLADRYEPRLMWAVVRAGADGYLTKTMSPEALVKSLDLAMLGEPVFPAAALSAFSAER